MKKLVALLFLLAWGVHAAPLRPEDIHPKIFQMVDNWISDRAAPVVTEINLDAVRRNRNQFDASAVKLEAGWITYREDASTLRFRVVSVQGDEWTVLFEDNGGGSLTTQRLVRFAIGSRSLEVDRRPQTATVLRVLSIATPAR